MAKKPAVEKQVIPVGKSEIEKIVEILVAEVKSLRDEIETLKNSRTGVGGPAI